MSADTLSVATMKTMLKEAGIDTSCRKKEKLIDLLKLNKLI